MIYPLRTSCYPLRSTLYDPLKLYQLLFALYALRSVLRFMPSTLYALPAILYYLHFTIYSLSTSTSNSLQTNNFGILLIGNAQRNTNSEKWESQSQRWDLNPRPSMIYPDVLTTGLLETLWLARVNLWILTGATSLGYTAK